MTDAAHRKRIEQFAPYDFFNMHCRTCGLVRKHKIVLTTYQPLSKFGWCTACLNYNEWSKEPDIKDSRKGVA